MISDIADDLSGKGWSAQPDYFPPDLIAELLRDMDGMDLQPAAIGRGSDRRIHSDIRNDLTIWLDGQGAAQNEYLRLMDALRIRLNQSLFLGLQEFEAHYARYAPGGFYRKHVDSLSGERNRIVSTVTYLTPGWRDADAGHLVLYDADDRELTRILPMAGTLAVFMSEDIPHEVLAPARERRSIAGWFRVRP